MIHIPQYCAIGEYAAIGDCHCAALVSRYGSIDWFCLPRFDSPSIFAAILDSEKGGHFAIFPSGRFDSEQNYIDRTNVLETIFTTAGGSARLIDLVPIASFEDRRRRLYPQREVLRTVECIDGEVEMRVQYKPRFEYGRIERELQYRGNVGLFCEYRDQALLLRATAPLQLAPENTAASGSFRIKKGQRLHFSLSYTQGEPAVIPAVGDEIERRLERTVEWWRKWISRCSYSGPYSDAVIRSLLALKLLTYSPSGAVIAAPTASLPEKIGGVRNWDYRFCWLRDASMTINAFYLSGYPEEAAAFLAWLIHATRLTRPELRVMYDIYGETSFAERELDGLDGYLQSRPVRIGNAAFDQLQLDIYGEVVDGAHSFMKWGKSFDRQTARMLRGLGKTVCRKWREPDQGIWEVRSGPRHHTFSKAMCWVALDRLLRMSGSGGFKVPVQEFASAREAIRSEIESKGFHPDLKSYTESFGSRQVDISLMLLPFFGYIEPDDPKMLSTYERVREKLERNGFFLRYISEDGLPPGEGGFLSGNFWVIQYLASLGKIDEACRRFDDVLSHAGKAGLFGEEIDLETGAMLGNYPQAYTHVGLINAALSIDNVQRKGTGASRKREKA